MQVRRWLPGRDVQRGGAASRDNAGAHDVKDDDAEPNDDNDDNDAPIRSSPHGGTWSPSSARSEGASDGRDRLCDSRRDGDGGRLHRGAAQEARGAAGAGGDPAGRHGWIHGRRR
eukprot:TRINITY_DN2235_c0_g1_i5.p2 TRINITY_DN2235_c0_g1~~TRINITY_DN2235_c0_g1_i5.p2  ORF type:complete len:115 (-),score=3.96 TRINITY_DN2235_c0_g1_i5:138-482(-)